MIGGPAPDPCTPFYGMFFQHDWKLSRRIPLNLGILNKYELAYYDPNHQLSKGLDLSQPVPVMQANPFQLPAASRLRPADYGGQASISPLASPMRAGSIAAGVPGQWDDADEVPGSAGAAPA
jgi:hypothetical protein